MRILIATIATLLLAAPVFGQPADDPHHPKGSPPTTQAASPGMMMGMMQGMKCPMMGGHAEGVLAFLNTELKITAAQTAAWEAFAKIYRAVAGSQPKAMGGGMMTDGAMGDGMGGGAMAAKPLPERMAMHTQMMERRLASAKKMQAAIQPFYASLDAKQKKTADELLPMIMMMAAM